tara:strand:+ start:247 stop:426 length:180 start_codon:yes stop_codon:yes gene_type:complete
MTEEEREKIKKSYESILENFPFDKYDDIIDNIRKLFDHPSARKGLLKYVKEELVDKNNV